MCSLHDDPRDIEQLVDESGLRFTALPDGLQAEGELRRLEISELQQVNPAQDRGQRRAQLMRQVGEKFILGAVRFLRAPIQARVVDGQRNPPRHLLGERDVGGLEAPPDVRPQERDHAERRAVGGHRNGDETAHPHREQQVTMLLIAAGADEDFIGDVVHHHRPPFP